MEDKALEKAEQVIAFTSALYILTMNDMVKLKQPDNLFVAMTCARVEGMLEAGVMDTFRHGGPVTCQQIQDRLLELQRNFLFGGNAAAANAMKKFLAQTTEHIDKAFDIAVKGKALPIASKEWSFGLESQLRTL